MAAWLADGSQDPPVSHSGVSVWAPDLLAGLPVAGQTVKTGFAPAPLHNSFKFDTDVHRRSVMGPIFVQPP